MWQIVDKLNNLFLLNLVGGINWYYCLAIFFKKISLPEHPNANYKEWTNFGARKLIYPIEIVNQPAHGVKTIAN